MTSTLASVRRLSVRFGGSTVDLAVPVGTPLRDLLESGGFPTGSHLVDASGASLPDDDRVGDVLEDGALVYVVDAAHTPSLTRITAPAPGRAAATSPATIRPADPAAAAAPAPGAVPAGSPAPTSGVFVDPAAAGARARGGARRAARGRPGATLRPGVAADPTRAPGRPPAVAAPDRAPSGPAPADPSDPAASAASAASDAGVAGRRRAVVPPVVRRGAPPVDGTGTGTGGRGLLPAPPGPARSPVPLPPGRPPGRAAHAARHGADERGAAPDPAGRADSTVVGTDLTPTRRPGTPAVPPPPRVAAPPSGATGRGAAAGRGTHRVATAEEERPATARGGPAEVPLSPGTFAVPLVLAPAAVLLVVLSTGLGSLPTWSTWTAGAALLLAGIVAALRSGPDPLERWGRIAGVVAGGAGGFVLAVSLDVTQDVSAVCGLIVASAVAMLGRTGAIRQGVFEPWVTVTAVGTGALAVEAALAITLSWPTYVGPLLLAGVAPLVLRALPAVSLDVPEEQLVDTERLSNTSWSARTGVRRRRRPLRQATVELITMRASGIVAAGTVAVALLVTCGYGVAVLSAMPGALARWALLAEGVLLLGGLGLSARTVRARFGKRVLRGTAAVVALETGFYLTRRTGDAGDVVLVALLVAAALGVIAVSLALDAGWRSLRLSRIADAAEGFCVVFALPAALLAADVIEVLRQAAS